MRAGQPGVVRDLREDPLQVLLRLAPVGAVDAGDVCVSCQKSSDSVSQSQLENEKFLSLTLDQCMYQVGAVDTPLKPRGFSIRSAAHAGPPC